MTTTTEKNDASVCAIIVTYYPEFAKIGQLVAAVSTQVDQVLIVNNSPAVSGGITGRLQEFPDIVVLNNQENLGVAGGHNKGIAWAREQNRFSHVLLIDQDSLPSRNMVKRLVAAQKNLIAAGQAVAAVGPQPIAPDSARCEPLICQQNSHVVKRTCNDRIGLKLMETLYIITSGSLISLDVLEKIGFMNESFFIDLVDMEWAFRARDKGFATFVSCSARMTHSIGEKKKTWPPSRRDITVHGPHRLYYQCRNYFLLLRSGYVVPGWALYYLLRHLIPRCIIFSFISPPRAKNFKMMLTGFWHGIIGRKGALDAGTK